MSQYVNITMLNKAQKIGKNYNEKTIAYIIDCGFSSPAMLTLLIRYSASQLQLKCQSPTIQTRLRESVQHTL